MNIDFTKLREDLISECLGAYFGGGFGAALVEESQIRYASNEKLLEIARYMGIDISRYIRQDL